MPWALLHELGREGSKGVTEGVRPCANFTRSMGSQIWPYALGQHRKDGRLYTGVMAAVPLALTLKPHNSDFSVLISGSS